MNGLAFALAWSLPGVLFNILALRHYGIPQQWDDPPREYGWVSMLPLMGVTLAFGPFILFAMIILRR